MNSTPIITGDIPLISIVLKYNFRKVLVFISIEGSGSTEPVDSYLSRFPEIYSNLSVHPIFCPRFLVWYLNTCGEIYKSQ